MPTVSAFSTSETPHSDVSVGSTGLKPAGSQCQVVVLWIDWYAYHVSRFRALHENPKLEGRVVGLEMVGGTGVHKGLKFREPIPSELPVMTLFPNANWAETSKWKLAVAIWQRLNELNPQTVFVPGYYNLPALAASLWAKCHGRSSVLMTESTESDHRRIWWREALKRLLIRSMFSWAIAGGRAHRRYLQNLKFPENRIGRFYDVVDNSFFWNAAEAERVRFRAEERGLPGQFFLYVGRLSPEKNVAGLLDAYLRYRKGGGTWSLVIVGGGPEENSLKTKAAESAVRADIHFAGLKTSSELTPYYAFAGCFVLPSSREPWGLVVNEAMAAGLPVIVSTACGCAEDLVQDGENGWMFQCQSENHLAQCLREIATAPKGKLRAMAAKSREIVAQYSPTAWSEEVARISKL